MAIRELKLDGPDVAGVRVNAALLRDVLALTIEAAERAVRLKTQGRSTAGGGPMPTWITRASDFTVEIREGSTVLELEAPSLGEADPGYFAQHDLFPDVSPELTSFDYLAAAFEAALHHPAVDDLDAGMLQSLGRFEKVFGHGVERLEFRTPIMSSQQALVVRERDLKEIRQLRRQIPPPQAVRLAGRLDLIKYSDGTFTIQLPGGEKVKGIAAEMHREQLQELWGAHALVLGTAHFGPSGRVIRVEADIVRAATEKDVQLWAIEPEPQQHSSREMQLRSPQGPRSGLNALFGRWPGDEDDEQILEALERMS